MNAPIGQHLRELIVKCELLRQPQLLLHRQPRQTDRERCDFLKLGIESENRCLIAFRFEPAQNVGRSFASIDQSASEQKTLAIFVASIAIAHLARFMIQLERTPNDIGRQQGESPLFPPP